MIAKPYDTQWYLCRLLVHKPEQFQSKRNTFYVFKTDYRNGPSFWACLIVVLKEISEIKFHCFRPMPHAARLNKSKWRDGIWTWNSDPLEKCHLRYLWVDQPGAGLGCCNPFVLQLGRIAAKLLDYFTLFYLHSHLSGCFGITIAHGTPVHMMMRASLHHPEFRLTRGTKAQGKVVTYFLLHNIFVIKYVGNCLVCCGTGEIKITRVHVIHYTLN